jgi:hypothetical protein
MTNYKKEPHAPARRRAGRIDAECPDCGIVVKMNAATGVYQAHAWINGCERVAPTRASHLRDHEPPRSTT